MEVKMDITASDFYFFTLLLFYPFTFLLFYSFTFLPFYFFTLLPFKAIVLHEVHYFPFYFL